MIYLAHVKVPECEGPVLAFKAPYNPQFIEELKASSPTRKYLAEKKVWAVDFEEFGDVVALIEEHFPGHEIVCDQEFLLNQWNHDNLGVPEGSRFREVVVEPEHYKVLGLPSHVSRDLVMRKAVEKKHALYAEQNGRPTSKRAREIEDEIWEIQDLIERLACKP